MFLATATATTATFLAKARVFYYDYDSCYHEGCDYHSQGVFLDAQCAQRCLGLTR